MWGDTVIWWGGLINYGGSIIAKKIQKDKIIFFKNGWRNDFAIPKTSRHYWRWINPKKLIKVLKIKNIYESIDQYLHYLPIIAIILVDVRFIVLFFSIKISFPFYINSCLWLVLNFDEIIWPSESWMWKTWRFCFFHISSLDLNIFPTFFPICRICIEKNRMLLLSGVKAAREACI